MILPSEYPDYSKLEYWNNRYKEERGKTYDWFLPYESLKDIIKPRLFDDNESEILVIGCGNSGIYKMFNPSLLELSEKLYQDGYHYITNADFSNVLIEEMRERNAHFDEMDCNNRCDSFLL